MTEPRRLLSLLASQVGGYTVGVDGGRPQSVRDVLADIEGQIQALEGALRPLVEACEHDFCNENTERQCADDSTVAYTEDQDDQLTFGHIRRARQVLDRKDV